MPADPNAYGYLSEHHAFGQNEKVAGDLAEDLAVEMLASTLGLEFDEDKSWDENKAGAGRRRYFSGGVFPHGC